MRAGVFLVDDFRGGAPDVFCEFWVRWRWGEYCLVAFTLFRSWELSRNVEEKETERKRKRKRKRKRQGVSPLLMPRERCKL